MVSVMDQVGADIRLLVLLGCNINLKGPAMKKQIWNTISFIFLAFSPVFAYFLNYFRTAMLIFNNLQRESHSNLQEGITRLVLVFSI